MAIFLLKERKRYEEADIHCFKPCICEPSVLLQLEFVSRLLLLNQERGTKGETDHEEKDLNKNFFHTALPDNAKQFISDCGLGRLGRRYGMLVLQPLPLG